MRSALRWSLALVLAAGLAVAASRLPRALSRVEAFRVADFELEGERFLTLDEAVRVAAVPAGASVWDETEPWEERLRGHPLVRDARVERNLPSTLVFRVEERTPVALVPGPVLEPVDASGRPLPIDPGRAHVDLPVLRPTLAGSGESRSLTPGELRAMAEELARIGTLDPGFAARISEMTLAPGGEVTIRLGEPRVSVLFRPPLTAHRLREGLRALSDAAGGDAYGEVRTVDLRYEEQVVIRTGRTASVRGRTPVRSAPTPN